MALKAEILSYQALEPFLPLRQLHSSLGPFFNAMVLK